MLENETAIFNRKLGEFLETHEKQFVLIKDDTIEFFPSEEKAIESGLRRFGVDSCFLVQQVIKKQPEVSIPALSIGVPLTS